MTKSNGFPRGLHDMTVAVSQRAIEPVVKTSYKTFINHRGEVISLATKAEMVAYNQDVQVERFTY